MITQIYTIHDVKAQCFLQPLFQPNDDTAKRLFSDAVNNPENFIGKNPSDYTLFHIGDYDDHTGLMCPIDNKSLGNGVEYLIPEKNKPKPRARKKS